MIREILKDDLDGLLRLYMQLHNNPMPEKTVELLQIYYRFGTIFFVKIFYVILFPSFFSLSGFVMPCGKI